MTVRAPEGGEGISRMCLGTVQLGTKYGRTNTTGQPGRAEVRDIVTAALAAGVLAFDTARGYGNAESLLGDQNPLITAKGAQIITKLDSLALLSDDASVEQVTQAVDTSVEESANALRLSVLDTLLLHRWSHFRAHRGAIWRRLLHHKKTGRIRRLGASIYTPAEALEALSEPSIEHLQLPFNILDWRWSEAGIENALARRPDVVVHARSVFLQGVLLADAGIWPGVDVSHARHTIDDLERLTRDFNLPTRAALCVAFVLSQPWIHKLVIGLERIEQLAENLPLLELGTLDSAELSHVMRRLPRAPLALLDPTRWPRERILTSNSNVS
jgi:aryl-alcohol dehydrogenase-like predicted oxidoreductase